MNEERRVLVAEDHPLNRLVLEELLGELGYVVDVVEDGNQALKAVEAREYAAVIVDSEMPELGGYEAARRIRARENGRRVPIVAVTAHSSAEERERARAADVDAFLTKPVSRAQLSQVLEELLLAAPARAAGPPADREPRVC